MNHNNTNNTNNANNTNNTKHTKHTISQVAIDIDNRLHYMAAYADTKGYTLKLDIGNNNIYEFFTDFKQKLQRGSYSIDELEQHVFLKYGPFSKSLTQELLNNINGIADISLDIDFTTSLEDLQNTKVEGN